MGPVVGDLGRDRARRPASSLTSSPNRSASSTRSRGAGGSSATSVPSASSRIAPVGSRWPACAPPGLQRDPADRRAVQEPDTGSPKQPASYTGPPSPVPRRRLRTGDAAARSFSHEPTRTTAPPPAQPRTPRRARAGDDGHPDRLRGGDRARCSAVGWVVATADSAPNLSSLHPRTSNPPTEIFAADGTPARLRPRRTRSRRTSRRTRSPARSRRRRSRSRTGASTSTARSTTRASCAPGSRTCSARATPCRARRR